MERKHYWFYVPLTLNHWKHKVNVKAILVWYVKVCIMYYNSLEHRAAHALTRPRLHLGSLEHRAAHALGHLVYVHISCISRASYALWDSYHAL